MSYKFFKEVCPCLTLFALVFLSSCDSASRESRRPGTNMESSSSIYPVGETEGDVKTTLPIPHKPGFFTSTVPIYLQQIKK